MLAISNPELRALACGEVIVAFVPRGSVSEGDEVELTGTGPLPPAALKPAYQRWSDVPAVEGLTAVVVAVNPAASLEPVAGAARHILHDAGLGDLVILRLFTANGPVLSDEAFAARKRSVEGALRE